MKFLDENKISFQYRDIMAENPSSKELKQWITDSQLPIKEFFNTRGLVYREMKLKDTINSLTDEEAIELLSTTGKLIKRPLLISDQGVLIGFNKEDYERLRP